MRFSVLPSSIPSLMLLSFLKCAQYKVTKRSSDRVLYHVLQFEEPSQLENAQEAQGLDYFQYGCRMALEQIIDDMKRDPRHKIQRKPS
jgi:hypothetical protein